MIDWNKGDDLNDLLGAPAAVHQLPQDEQLTRIRALDGLPQAPTFKITCQKCNGSGRFSSWAGRDCGPCFKCEGRGSFERKTAPAQLAKNRAQAADRREQSRVDNAKAFEAAHPTLWAWMVANPRFQFAVEMLDTIMKFGQLTTGQFAAVERCAQRDAQKVTQRVQAAPQVDASKIVATFQRARESGLEKIKLRFEGITIKPAQFDKNVLLVKAGMDRIGKIEAGRFVAFRACTPELQAQVLVVLKDPMAAAQAYGFATSSCCICGLKLTNKESIETGIGPICSGRLSWTPGRLKVTSF